LLCILDLSFSNITCVFFWFYHLPLRYIEVLKYDLLKFVKPYFYIYILLFFSTSEVSSLSRRSIYWWTWGTEISIMRCEHLLPFMSNRLFLLSAYNTCRGGTLWYLHMCLQYILIIFTPFSTSLYNFNRFHYPILIHDCKNTSTFPNALSSLTGIHPQKRPDFTLLVFIFKKYIVTVQRGLSWHFRHVYIQL
jgi:hypothetical protein